MPQAFLGESRSNFRKVYLENQRKINIFTQKNRMSSLLNTYDQVDKRIQYFISLVNTTIYTVNSGQSVTSLMTTASFSSATTSGTKLQGTIYRDTGKIVITYDSEGKHIARYVRVQEVNGIYA